LGPQLQPGRGARAGHVPAILATICAAEAEPEARKRETRSTALTNVRMTITFRMFYPQEKRGGTPRAAKVRATEGSDSPAHARRRGVWCSSSWPLGLEFGRKLNSR